MSLTVAPLHGADLADALPDLARLRIEVFRSWPYLYDGTLDYEAGYLSKFAGAEHALIVAARDGGRIVGCSTGSALAGHHPEFAAPLAAAGIDPAPTFYCGESVLLPDYRGRGIGHEFFDQREEHARKLGYARSSFCGVVRPDDHRLKPPSYRSLDAFWTQRGYAKLDGAFAHFAWKDIDEREQTVKPMQVWLRNL